MARLSDEERAQLIGLAMLATQRAALALSRAQCPEALALVMRTRKALQRSYTLITHRQRYEIRCVHGTLLSVTCRACAAAAG